MKARHLEELMLWISKELKSIKHGEIHVILKVHDSRISMVEKIIIERRKPVEGT